MLIIDINCALIIEIIETLNRNIHNSQINWWTAIILKDINLHNQIKLMVNMWINILMILKGIYFLLFFIHSLLKYVLQQSHLD